MPHYRCDLLVGKSIKSVQSFDAPDDARALEQAKCLILEGDALAAEVWQEQRFVGHWIIGPDLRVIRGGKR